MTQNNEFPRCLIFATWFGHLPSWFPLWLTSCRYNTVIDWALLTDAPVPDIEVPNNVHIVPITMSEFAARIREASGVNVQFKIPYKACDYRPVYWCFLDLVPGDWEFWGHCDLDLIFGDLEAFITPELLATHDRIFGVGHLSLYRNSDLANKFFQRPHDDIDFRRILADPEPRGFDEHIGVNRIWHAHQGRFYENEDVVIDIDPHIQRLRRMSTNSMSSNSRLQMFGFDRGRVSRYYWLRGDLRIDRYMYMHFQKRRFDLPPLPPEVERAWLTPRGFVEMQEPAPTPELARQLNPTPVLPNGSELFYRSRRRLRIIRRMLGAGQN